MFLDGLRGGIRKFRFGRLLRWFLSGSDGHPDGECVA